MIYAYSILTQLSVVTDRRRWSTIRYCIKWAPEHPDRSHELVAVNHRRTKVWRMQPSESKAAQVAIRISTPQRGAFGLLAEFRVGGNAGKAAWAFIADTPSAICSPTSQPGRFLYAHGRPATRT